MKPLISLAIRCLCILTPAHLVPAATIDFEQINAATPLEGMTISNQFEAYYGVSFRIPNGWPAIARVGWPQAAFDRSGPNESDTVRSTQTNLIGQFFLVDAAPTETIILDFRAPVSLVSGFILDIDANEQITISAYADSTTTNALESILITSATPNTGDGLATYWSLSRPTKDIRRIEFLERGPLGHDLLSSDYTPPPAPPANLGLTMYPGLTIRGAVGRPYRIDYADQLDRTPSTTNWHPLTTIFLPRSPYLFLDTTATNSPERYYRALNIP